MINITVRPIRIGEFPKFLSIGTSHEHLEDIKKYVNELLESGCTRLEWCYVLENKGDFLGKFIFWSLPKLDKPLDIVLLDLDLSNKKYLELGTLFLEKIKKISKDLSITNLGYVLDSPSQYPQWQEHFNKRSKLLETSGFKVSRKTKRFIYSSSTSFDDLNYESFIVRSLEDVSDNEYIKAILEVSKSTLDERINFDINSIGALAQAEQNFEVLKNMDYKPSWWKLIYDKMDNSLIGLVMPTIAPSFGTIGYIGVIPEKRGKGYVDVLLSLGTKILLDNDVTIIKADTDINNLPMANAFIKAGYHQFATRNEYIIEL